jgi:hypothetical protein
MSLNYKRDERDPLWVTGEYSDYYYGAKVYDEGSEYGINGGRVSKLYVREDGESIVHYDRGWDSGNGKYITSIYGPLVEQLENLPPIPEELWENAIQINENENRMFHQLSYLDRIKKFLGG